MAHRGVAGHAVCLAVPGGAQRTDGALAPADTPELAAGAARRGLHDIPLRTDGLTGSQIASRLPAVRQILYLLFTEGYLSCRAETAIRRELCSEAIRLATLLAAHPLGAAPETFALLALMHLHAARMTARQDASGGLVLLEEQDRDLWDQRGIELGMTWLAGTYQWAAVLADLHRRSGNTRTANRYRTRACNAAPTPVLKDLLERRLASATSADSTPGSCARHPQPRRQPRS